MSDTNDTPKPARLKPWLRFVLIGSLAVNFLIVGVVAGAVLLHDSDKSRRPARLDNFGGPLTGALEKDARRDIGKQMREHFRANGPSRADLRQEFEALVGDLRQVPFDPSPVRARMQRQRDGVAKRLELGQRLLLEHLMTMSDAERAAYADRVEGGLKRLPGGKRPHH